MKNPFSKIIDAIDAQINPVYIGGAIQWADETMNNRWSMAIHNFEEALISKDFFRAQKAGNIYLAEVMDMLAKYKASRKAENPEDLLNQMSMDFGL